MSLICLGKDKEDFSTTKNESLHNLTIWEFLFTIHFVTRLEELKQIRFHQPEQFDFWLYLDDKWLKCS